MLKKYLLLILMSLMLCGCATGASVDQMIPHGIPTLKPKNVSLANNITVNQTLGGHETNPLWTSQISNANFKAALIQSLQQANLYHQFNGSGYALNATFVRLQQPFLGVSLTVRCTVNYVLENLKTNKVIYSRRIATSYTATFSDSPLATTRLRMANEGAARENIKELITDLYQLKKSM
ncbi:MAG: hypothetical protein WBE18_01790 [Gammaproteobacteria bacterium]